MALIIRFLRGKFTLPIAVLATGALLSLALAGLARQEIERSAEQRFDAVAIDAARQVEARFDAYTEVLIGLRALFNTGDAVSRQQFRHYVSALRLQSHFPGFQVLNYAAYVPAGDKADFEQRLRSDTSLDAALAARLAVLPPGDRPGYHPLSLIEPLAGNEQALGKDLAAVPAALKALERARDSGGLTSSGRKIGIKGRESDIGLAMRLPVYRSGMPQDTVEERRAAYLGSVGAGFRVGDMMRDVVANPAHAGLRMRLFETGPSRGELDTRIESRPIAALPEAGDNGLLFDSAPAAAASAGSDTFVRTLGFELGGHAWAVQVSQDASLVVGKLDRAIPALIVLCGLAISVLLAGIVYSLTTSRGRAEGIARSMTSGLRRSERRLDEAQRLASLGSWVLDERSGELQCSAEALRILGFDDEEGRPSLAAMLSRVPEPDRAAVQRHIARASQTRQRAEFEHGLCLPGGIERWVHVIVQQTEEGGRAMLRGTLRDDTQRRKGALRLKLEHEIARLLVADGDAETVISRVLEAICGHMRWDAGALWGVGDNGVVRCAASWHAAGDPALEQFARISRSLSYRADEGSLGLAWVSDDVVAIDTATAGSGQFTRDALAGQAGLALGLVVPTVESGHATALELFSRQRLPADTDTVESLRAIGLQLAQYQQRKRVEQALRYVASHDALTGLANRTALQHELARAVKRSNRHQKRFAVMFLDIDRFKRINDTLGHGVGDSLIRACGERLSGLLREDDVVARFGGDEFVLVVENLSKASDASVVAEKVLACCAEAFVIGERELHVTASIGISIYPEDGADGETLLMNADTAMYRAKDKARGSHEFYAAQMNAHGTERLMIESGLRRAIERGELELHYQPKLDLRSDRIAGVEALMRWQHPVLGSVSPAQFIPIAEESGLIVEMGRWALHKACADAREWKERGLPAVQMSVNLSPRQLNSPALIDDIDAALNASGLSPELLELEITESAVMKNPEAAATLLQQIREMGVGLAIDDFGTGYSSLSYLKRFPLSTVKIDRSFVKDLAQDRDAEALTDGIVTLAHGLRMKVVAEGVETDEQLAYLRAHGCDEIQGYWLCRPVPADQVCQFMARHLRKQFAAPVAA